jgi:hypothetical protein
MIGWLAMKTIDFMKLMGRGKRCWKHVQTQGDRRDLEGFERLFQANYREVEGELMIPEILHFVWLGPKAYPPLSLQYLKGWMEFHPGWMAILWSDCEREDLPKGVQLKIVGPKLLGEYLPLYESTDNFGERSDLVRLLALDEMGGVYVDHDMECRMSFAPFHKIYPFYGGLLTPGNPVIQRSALVRNSIIGSRKGDPILKRALSIMETRWDEIGKKYPGQDVTSVKKRVTLRSFVAFHEAVLESIQRGNFKGILFPAGCFNEIEKEFGLFAKEDMVGAWYTSEMTHHEEYLKDRLHRLMKRMHFLFALLAIGFLFLVVAVTLLWIKV